MDLLNGEAEVTIRGVFNRLYNDKRTQIESNVTAKATLETDDQSGCMTVVTLSDSFYFIGEKAMHDKTHKIKTKETVEEIETKIKNAFLEEKEGNLALLKKHRVAPVV